MRLNLLLCPTLTLGNQVDGRTLATKPTRTTNTVNVVLTLERQLVINHNGNLLNVNATSQQVRGDEHTALAVAELRHPELTLRYIHIAVNVVEVKAAALHLVRQPLRLLTRVDEDSRLLDAQVVVKIAQRVQLVVLTRDLHKPLLDALQAHLLRLQKNLHRVAENALRHRNDVRRHRRGKKCHLR